jgi:hypothetical protein
MNSQPEEDLQRRLQQLEAKINSSSTPPKSAADKIPQLNISSVWNFDWEKLRVWFNSLSKTKKLATLGGGLLLSYLLLQVVFKLVAAVISLAVIAVVVYVGYKFFVSINFQNKQ